MAVAAILESAKQEFRLTEWRLTIILRRASDAGDVSHRDSDRTFRIGADNKRAWP
jgi:hypothetical protein